MRVGLCPVARKTFSDLQTSQGHAHEDSSVHRWFECAKHKDAKAELAAQARLRSVEFVDERISIQSASLRRHVGSSWRHSSLVIIVTSVLSLDPRLSVALNSFFR